MGLGGYYRPNDLQLALFVEYLFSFILNDKQKHIVVVGAGPGGLTAAMLLGARGFRVTLVEKDSALGGRNAAIDLNGYKFDTGPTFLMMKFILDEVFEEAGRASDDYLDFV